MTSALLENRPARVESLTGLRWWAAFAVFAHHMSNFAPLPIPGALKYGTFGVTFFFVLSGFVLTWSASRKVGPGTFWVRRWARIYPAYFVALLLAIPVFYTFAGAPGEGWQKPFEFLPILLAVLLLQGWSRDPEILFAGNPAGWTLTVEAFFYALHPGINRMLMRVGKRGALIAAAGVLVALFGYRIAAFAVPELITAVPVPILHLPDFLLGMALAWAVRSGWRFALRPIWAYSIAGVGVLGLILAPRVADVFPPAGLYSAFTNELMVAFCGLVIVAVAARDVRGEPSLLRRRVLVVLGELSYSFYLIHATVIYFALLVFGFHPGSWTNLVWYLALLAVSILVSAALHYGVERPLERLIRTRWDRWRLARSRRLVDTSRPVA